MKETLTRKREQVEDMINFTSRNEQDFFPFLKSEVKRWLLSPHLSPSKKYLISAVRTKTLVVFIYVFQRVIILVI